jgi:hypothetical protein
MALKPSAPTAAAPYIYLWTAASMDLTSTTANTAPALLGTLPAGDNSAWAPIIACDSSTANDVEMTLCLVDNAAYAGAVIWAQPIVFASSKKRQAAGNGSGLYLMYPSGTYYAADLRGVNAKDRAWYLCCSALGATATQVALVQHITLRAV